MRLNIHSLPSDCFAFRLSGLPCYVCVTHYEPEIPANLSGHPDSWTPSEGGELEFEVYDRKGYRAEWLEEKVDDTSFLAIEAAYLEHRRKYGQDH